MALQVECVHRESQRSEIEVQSRQPEGKTGCRAEGVPVHSGRTTKQAEDQVVCFFQSGESGGVRE